MPDEQPETDLATPPSPARKPSTKAFGTGGMNALGSGGLTPAFATQDLSADRLLAAAPRLDFDSKSVPALGGFPIVAKLGQGGMGAVYYALNPRLGTEVAIKVLLFNPAEQDSAMIGRFMREARVAAGIESPHLVGVKDINESGGLYFIVMEFVRGTTANKIASSAPGGKGISELHALEICAAACDGLAAAHAQGIIHRDIKPANIMVPFVPGTQNPACTRAKLADLGLARDEAHGKSLTGTAAFLGTPGYMPPEQIDAAEHAGKPADVFALGATLYALLSGRTPFYADRLMEIIRNTSDRPHKPIRDLRPDVSEMTGKIIDKCLAKKPDERFKNAAELKDELNKSLESLRNPPKTMVKPQLVSSLTSDPIKSPKQPAITEAKRQAFDNALGDAERLLFAGKWKEALKKFEAARDRAPDELGKQKCIQGTILAFEGERDDANERLKAETNARIKAENLAREESKKHQNLADLNAREKSAATKLFPPIIDLVRYRTCAVGESISITAIVSDPNNYPIALNWTSVDGKITILKELAGSTTITLAPPQADSYQLRLEALNSYGARAFADVMVEAIIQPKSVLNASSKAGFWHALNYWSHTLLIAFTISVGFIALIVMLFTPFKNLLSKAKGEPLSRANKNEIPRTEVPNEVRRNIDENRSIAEKREMEAREVENSRKDEALKFKGIFTIQNPFEARIKYRVRWKNQNGNWTEWIANTIDKGQSFKHSCIGARDCEIEVPDEPLSDTTRISKIAYMLQKVDAEDSSEMVYHHFQIGTDGLLDFFDGDVAVAEAMKYQCVFALYNAGTRTTMKYSVRYKFPRDKFGEWEDGTLDNNYQIVLSKVGAIGAELMFNGQTYTLKTNKIPSGNMATEADCNEAKQNFQTNDSGKTYEFGDGDGSRHRILGF